jgi:hypothetical protein
VAEKEIVHIILRIFEYLVYTGIIIIVVILLQLLSNVLLIGG